MSQVSRRGALGIAVLAALSVAGCQPAAAPTSASGDMNSSDLDFVTNAANIIIFDREECTSAQSQARTPAVRAIAAKLLDDANMFDAKLQAVLAQAGVKAPTQIRSDLRVRLSHMRLQSGLDFDRTFLEDQIATHEEIINRQQMMSGTPGMNPQIIQLAAAGSEILKRNLAELRSLQMKMMTMR